MGFWGQLSAKLAIASSGGMRVYVTGGAFDQ